MNNTNADKNDGKPKLSVRSLVLDAYRLLYNRFRTFIFIMWLPSLVSALSTWRFMAQSAEAAVIDPASEELVAEVMAAELSVWAQPLTYVYEAMLLVTFAAASVAVQRLVLLNEEPPRPYGIAMGKREVRYSGYTFASYVLASFPLVLIVAVGAGLNNLFGEDSLPTVATLLLFTLGFGGLFFLVVAALRFGLAFPAVALDTSRGVMVQLLTAWEMAKGNTFKLFLAMLLAWLPFVVIDYLVGDVFGSGVDVGASLTSGDIAFLVFSSVEIFTMYFIWAAITARAYAVLSQGPTDHEPLVENA